MQASRIPTRRRARPIACAAALLLAAALSGCGTYVNTATQVRVHTSQGDISGALEVLEKSGGKDPDVLNLMERGLLLFYDGRFEDSNELLQRADAKIEEIFEAGLAQQALSILTNDATLPYLGYPHEQVMLHVYGALNYTALGQREPALVECRRAGVRLAQMEDLRTDKKGYTDDAFAEWLAGILYANDGDANGALVSARRAKAAYQEAGELWGMPTPPAFLSDYERWATRFGFGEEAAELLEQHPDLEPRPPLGPREGEVVLIYESGYVANLTEVRLDLPILGTDDDRDNDKLAHDIYGRGYRGHLAPGVRETEIVYWLSVAFPQMVRQPYELKTARMTIQDQGVDTQVVQDVSAIAQLTFDEGAGKRAVRTIVRGLLKYWASHELKKENEGLGLLANIVGSATERADTRSWSTLPDRIHIARMRMPAGRYPVQVDVLDARGNLGETLTFQNIVVTPGQTTVIHHRSYR